MTDWLTPALALLSSLAAGGLIGTVLTHRRLAPKSEAETHDMDWNRFQREIARLDAKVAAQGIRIDELETEIRQCHAEKEELNVKIIRMEAVMAAEGHARQLAAGVVAIDRLESKK